ncbi:MAG: hypothetical protein KAH01_03435 [Caldisericia bacterium]|nr:hypothetical protein [Caldisericia bacterium]
MYQDKVIQDYLKKIDPEHVVEDNMLLSIMDRIEKSRKDYKRKKHLLQFITPFAVILIIAVTSIFPVFGSEKGSLVDVYNSYRVNKSIDDLTKSTEMMKQDQNVRSFMYSSLLENEYEIDPVELLELKYSHNIPPKEAAVLLLISKRTNVPIEKMIAMRKRRMDWGLIAKRSRISSEMVISSIKSLQKKYIDTPKDGFVINGRITGINRSINCFFVERFPYPIFFSPNDKVIEALRIETPVSVELKYNSEQVKYFASVVHVRPLSPNRPIFFIGNVISIHSDTLVLGLINGRRLVLKTPVHFSKMLRGDEHIEIGSRMRIVSFVNRDGVNCMINYWIEPDINIETIHSKNILLDGEKITPAIQNNFKKPDKEEISKRVIEERIKMLEKLRNQNFNKDKIHSSIQKDVQKRRVP